MDGRHSAFDAGQLCYTGHKVWNKQSRTEVLVDPHNVSLGTPTLMRWNRREDWVTSREIAHPAIVSVADYERAQHTRAVRTCAQRTYLLHGLLRCGFCGRRLEGAWNNGRANTASTTGVENRRTGLPACPSAKTRSQATLALC
jgi:site-specific DNA recombinase